MPKNLPIFDGDRHVIEPLELWKDYLAPEFRQHAPYFEYLDRGEPLQDRVAYIGPEGAVTLPPDLMIDGKPVMNDMTPRTRIELALAAAQRHKEILAGQTPQGHIEQMDRAGIDTAVLYPTLAMFITCIDDMEPALVQAYAQAYNDWLHDFCSYAPQRLIAAGLIPRHDPAHMLTELERIAAFGWNTVVLRPNPVRGRILSDPTYEPFWSACERLKISVAIHEGAHTRLATTGADRFKTRFAQHACSHPMEQMMALLALIEGGVLERHPNLQVAFLEAGCSWLPYWLWRLDNVEYQHLAGEVAEHVRIKPSDYFRRQCWIAIEPDEPQLRETINWIGEDRVLFGTDFPHLDHTGEIVEDMLKLREQWPQQLLEKLLWMNSARFYRY
jgi:predicted TIM-barrel fold metal-dependent hydrolase